MFTSLKLYLNEEILPEQICKTLVEFGYSSVGQVQEEGDFARRGEILDIYPVTFECPVRVVLNFNRIETIASFDSAAGKPILQHTAIIILPKNKEYRQEITKLDGEAPLNLFIELKKGNLAVHVQHGIGKYLGIQKVDDKDCFVLEYANNEKLFVPLKDSHLIQRFTGFKGAKPKVNRLGTKEWETIKNRAKKGIQSYAFTLLKMQAQRKVLEGYSFSPDTAWQADFEKGFPYKETPGQIKALAEVKKDMESRYPMDRLLCGDVGYGKTEVAMRAAFKAVSDNKQVAFLVPTTILAEQHFQNFQARLKDFPVTVAMLSRFRTHKEQEEIIKKAAEGGIDIVIGTHRLLSDDISFKNLGLVIIDEEQRFGVKAKEKLKNLRDTVDLLTLTATPIPRTLYMGMMGAKDISVIDTPPQNRMPVATYVVEDDADLVAQSIRRELRRGGQIFFIHNRVQDIEKVTLRVKNMVSKPAITAYAHGQMPEKQLEQIMLDFLNKKIDCLVSTTIVESGIDMPTANTLIVNNAHNFGLSELHQLRGRVGRFDRKAYAYFLIRNKEILSEDARARLEALKEYSQLGAGFKIAMQDLEIRGAGNLLGVQQHGFIQTVGFDLYCRLLREMIEQIKTVLEEK